MQCDTPTACLFAHRGQGLSHTNTRASTQIPSPLETHKIENAPAYLPTEPEHVATLTHRKAMTRMSISATRLEISPCDACHFHTTYDSPRHTCTPRPLGVPAGRASSFLSLTAGAKKVYLPHPRYNKHNILGARRSDASKSLPPHDMPPSLRAHI